jgi:hypothetical protein
VEPAGEKERRSAGRLLLSFDAGLATVTPMRGRRARADPKEPQMPDKLTLRQAVEKVLTGKRAGMTVAEITEQAIPLTRVAGATPKQQVYSLVYSEGRRPDGLVVKVREGKGGPVKLNPKRRKAAA